MDEFIKKLIERLEELHGTYKKQYLLGIGNLQVVDGCQRGLEDAIEIANELAEEYNNDFCEWKSEKDIFIQNPHTCRKFSNEPSMKNIYCNTCGKKIRVISAEQSDSTTEAWKQQTMSRFERVE